MMSQQFQFIMECLFVPFLKLLKTLWGMWVKSTFLLSWESISAPVLYRSSTTFRCPPLAANHSGELPFLFFTSTWASLQNTIWDINVNNITFNGVRKSLPSLYIHTYIYIYTGCPRRKGPNFGRVFLRSNYNNITQNTYIQSSMVMEILAREKCGCLLCLRTVICPWRHTGHMHLPSTR